MTAKDLSDLILRHPEYEVHLANIFVRGAQSKPIRARDVQLVESDKTWIIFPPPAETVLVTNRTD